MAKSRNKSLTFVHGTNRKRLMTMRRKPLILLTNDDGYQAKGINELIKGLKGLGELVVLAPDGPRSGMASAITTSMPIKYKLIKQEDDLRIYRCTGTPVDCVKLAINVLLDRRPDLLVSGINHGGNMAICVQYSGTMGAAAEGCVFDVPSIGISLLDFHEDANFTECCRLGRLVAEKVLTEGLPKGTYLNLNLPTDLPIKGMKVCHQADGRWVNEFMESENGNGEKVYWLTGSFRNDDKLSGNDVEWLDKGYASLVPCKIDVTDYGYLKQLESWNLG